MDLPGQTTNLNLRCITLKVCKEIRLSEGLEGIAESVLVLKRLALPELCRFALLMVCSLDSLGSVWIAWAPSAGTW